jgi:FixJ family two-component response regulator
MVVDNAVNRRIAASLDCSAKSVRRQGVRHQGGQRGVVFD